MDTLIGWLNEAEQDRGDLVGGKGASLARLLQMGLPVPQGFVVTTEAYRAFVAINKLSEGCPEEMGERILAAPMPQAISMPILEAYQGLGGSPVAVRSSGTAEDLASASLAGQHDTFLNVMGEQTPLANVQACWASLWSPRAVEYRRQHGWHKEALAMAVVVQTMIPAEWAGVVFTADPVTGQRDRVIVEAVPELGENQVLIKLLEGHMETGVAESIRTGNGPEALARLKGAMATALKNA